jgi:TonB family protein
MYILTAFIILSFAVHFTLGPALTALSPAWRPPDIPEQAVSVITVSKLEQQRVAPTPTPQPLPTPITIKRSNLDLSLVQLREMVNGASLGKSKVRPASKTQELELRHLVKIKPRDSASAPLAVAEPRLKPPSRKLAFSSRIDTGGTSDLAGATQWGDDNPPQILTRAPLASGAVPSQPARIKVEVGPDGNVFSVTLEASSGDPNFDHAALDAARHSTYAPATLNGLPIHGTCLVEYPSSAGST